MTDFRPVTVAEARAHHARTDTEAALQTRIIKAAQAAGWLVYHTHDSRRSQAGFPDLVLVHPDRKQVLYRELKTEKGRLRPEQQEWLLSLRAAGVDAEVWRPAQWFDGTIPNILTGRDPHEPLPFTDRTPA
jgi:hypothetical protein